MGYSELDKTYLLLRSINWCTVVLSQQSKHRIKRIW